MNVFDKQYRNYNIPGKNNNKKQPTRKVEAQRTTQPIRTTASSTRLDTHSLVLWPVRTLVLLGTIPHQLTPPTYLTIAQPCSLINFRFNVFIKDTANTAPFTPLNRKRFLYAFLRHQFLETHITFNPIAHLFSMKVPPPSLLVHDWQYRCSTYTSPGKAN
jgi:hypothetical protein